MLWALRISLPVLVFAMTLIAIEEGVDFSDRPGMPQAGLAQQVYYATGLFFFGGLDLGVPVGGPRWAYLMMWCAYFLAPIVTASAVIEGAIRTVNPSLIANPMRRHTVVVGDTLLAERLLTRIGAKRFGRSVIWVHSSPDRTVPGIAARHLAADIGNDRTLDALKLHRARRVLLLTDDDFTNLDAATRILQRAPNLAGHTIVHVKDARMSRATRELTALDGAVVFNTHVAAARHLVQSQLIQHFDSTEPRDIVVLAGFGRFGQAILRELLATVPEAFETVILVDLAANKTARIFDENSGFSATHQRIVIDGDLKDPGVWHAIDEQVGSNREPVFVLASGDDGTNVRTALTLRQSHPEAYIVARTFAPSVFAHHAASQAGFALVSIAELLDESLPGDWSSE